MNARQRKKRLKKRIVKVRDLVMFDSDGNEVEGLPRGSVITIDGIFFEGAKVTSVDRSDGRLVLNWSVQPVVKTIYFDTKIGG